MFAFLCKQLLRQCITSDVPSLDRNFDANSYPRYVKNKKKPAYLSARANAAIHSAQLQYADLSRLPSSDSSPPISR